MISNSMSYVSGLWGSGGKGNKDTYMLETMSSKIEELNQEVEGLREDLSSATESLK